MGFGAAIDIGQHVRRQSDVDPHAFDGAVRRRREDGDAVAIVGSWNAPVSPAAGFSWASLAWCSSASARGWRGGRSSASSSTSSGPATSPQTRKVVTFLGRYGGIARGIVFGAAGVFLLIAAFTANAHKAKGIDATLRAFTKTPAGPWLLVLVAVGLILFGCYSWAESRWRKV